MSLIWPWGDPQLSCNGKQLDTDNIGYKSAFDGISIGSTLGILVVVTHICFINFSVISTHLPYTLWNINMDNEISQETLLRVENNDDALTNLVMNNVDNVEGLDFNRLGRAIATNTNITKLDIALDYITDTGTEFYEGLKQNTSIDKLNIYYYEHDRDVNGVGRKILQAYQENNNHLIAINFLYANLHNEEATQIATTLQCCTNLKTINLYQCDLTADQLLPMIEAMRGLRSLEQLFLNNNNIGNVGCEALGTLLLKDPNCNISKLQINRNGIGNEGVISLVNNLANNTKLKALALYNNPIDGGSVEDVFAKILCNTTSINATYSSNHTLELVECDYLNRREVLGYLFGMNKGTNKRNVAIKKILRHHPDIDMEPLFGWDMDGEWSLKALPCVIDWCERACAVKVGGFTESPAFVQELERDLFGRRTLSAIYKFARAMPLRFVPADHVKMHDKKRKRES